MSTTFAGLRDRSLPSYEREGPLCVYSRHAARIGDAFTASRHAELLPGVVGDGTIGLFGGMPGADGDLDGTGTLEEAPAVGCGCGGASPVSTTGTATTDDGAGVLGVLATGAGLDDVAALLGAAGTVAPVRLAVVGWPANGGPAGAGVCPITSAATTAVAASAPAAAETVRTQCWRSTIATPASTATGGSSRMPCRLSDSGSGSGSGGAAACARNAASATACRCSMRCWPWMSLTPMPTSAHPNTRIRMMITYVTYPVYSS